jgi:hypothetical protein
MGMIGEPQGPAERIGGHTINAPTRPEEGRRVGVASDDKRVM